MGSGGGGGGRGSGSSKGITGRKRKADGDGEDMPPARREPRRGLGVAALERIRTQLETVESFCPDPLLLTPAAAPPPPPPPSLVGHVPCVRCDLYVGNGPVLCTPYYGAHHYTDGALTRLLASNGHAVPVPSQNQVDQNVVVAIKTPLLEQLLLQDHRRRVLPQPEPEQYGQTRAPQATFVNLVDSDDEGAAAVEELDLELKL